MPDGRPRPTVTFNHRNFSGRELVRALRVGLLRHSLHRAPGSSPDPDVRRVPGPSPSQGLPVAGSTTARSRAPHSGHLQRTGHQQHVVSMAEPLPPESPEPYDPNPPESELEARLPAKRMVVNLGPSH